LKHQKTSSFAPSSTSGAPRATFTDHYKRGQAAAAGPAPTKFLPGSCTNCGSTTHKVRDCLERPRAKGAALTGQNLAAPDSITQLEFSYDAKRDRWAGYDTAEYSKVIRRFEQTEAERKKKKLAELDAAFQAEKEEEKRRKQEEEERKARGESEDAAAAASAAGAGGDDAAAAAAVAGDPVAEQLRLPLRPLRLLQLEAMMLAWFPQVLKVPLRRRCV